MRDAALVDCRYGHALRDELATAGDRLSEWRSARSVQRENRVGLAQD
jgi:hypothetical protein